MSDSQSPEEQEGFIQEHTEGTIIGNLDLLRLSLVGKAPGEVVDEKMQGALWAIKKGEGGFVEGGVENSLKITYSTASGEINQVSAGAQFGEFSRINTWVRETKDNDKTYRSILLQRPGGVPSVPEITKDITGMDTGEHDPEIPIIVPERIDYEHQDLVGEREAWGQSDFVSNAKGDITMLNTIRKFNATYGPPR